MGNIKDRISMIKEYFDSFNIIEGAAYALVRFPSKWTVLNEFDMDGCVVNTVSDRNKNGYYFFTDFENGFDCIFDAIDEVINFNKSIEEKTDLLIAKAQELKELFETEDIDRLRTLRFVMEGDGASVKPKKGKVGKNCAKKPKQTAKKDAVTVKDENHNTVQVINSDNKIEEVVVPAADNVEGGSLMDLACNMVEEG